MPSENRTPYDQVKYASRTVARPWIDSKTWPFRIAISLAAGAWEFPKNKLNAMKKRTAVEEKRVGVLRRGFSRCILYNNVALIVKVIK